MSTDAGGKAPLRPGRPRSATAHRAVLRATLEIFGDAGFHGLTVEGVAARAGVARTTVYRWWPSKLALLLEALSALWQQAVVPDTGSVREDAVAHLRGFIELHNDRRVARLLATLLAEASRNAELLEARPSFVAAQREPLRRALERGVARGELPVGLDHELTMDLLMSVITVRALATGGALEPGLAERIVDPVLNGLVATRPGAVASSVEHGEAREVPRTS